MTDLQTAIKDLRDALIDEDAGNGHVRDCAFEVVDAHAADDGRTPTEATAPTMTLTDKAAKLRLRVETEPHGAGAGIAGYTVFRGGQWLLQGTEAEAHAFLDGYGAALVLRGCP